ncbi:MAG: hypothetical protein ABS79_00730 [Planctomycetes bacterium SCN 63-9]|nr:MAG: hypothetical protein ABS79_00730 [Planctomycetes bacterium SCN 63-9]
MRVTNDEQLLTNLVRLRYADSPVFVDLPSITSQFEVGLDANYNGGYGLQFPGTASLGLGQLSLRDTPTLSYHPRQGREIAKALLNPLTADLVSVVNAGARMEQLFWMTLNDINDVQNAVHATTLVPRVPDDNAEFLRGVRLLAEIDNRGGAEIGFSTSENADSSSDPIPAKLVHAQDLVGAAKEGYVFRTFDGDRVVLRKREKDLTLKIRAPFTHSEEMKELARIFHLTPGLSRYKIKSELIPNAESSAPHLVDGLPHPLGDDDKPHDTIYLNLRSILQVMTFLSKGVCVPEEHVISGVAPSTPGPDGRPYNWTGIMAGNFFVASQKHRPKDAEVAIQYRGYWFYIPRDDVNSRSVLAVLEILFTLQESDEKAAGPVLTLPAGG